MNKEYIKQYVQLEKEHWWFVVRQKILFNFLSKQLTTKPKNILNIGAAAGESSKWLSALGKVTSVEMESLFVELLVAQNLEVVNANIVDMPFENNSFDLVCAFDVLEHVEFDIDAMIEMVRVCKPNGKICIAVPAFNILWSKHDTVNGHFRRYSKKMFKTLGDNFVSIEQKEVTYFNTILFLPILIARKMRNLFLKDSGNQQSDFTYFNNNKIVNYILKAIFSIELLLLKFMKLPFGVSLVSVWQKLDSNKQ
jgi:SAM-dependent methyltransferase